MCFYYVVEPRVNSSNEAKLTNKKAVVCEDRHD